MQYISFNSTTIITPDIAKRLAAEAEFDHSTEPTKPARILDVRYDHNNQARDPGFPGVDAELAEEYLADDQKYSGWKLVAAWTGAVVASWALLIGGVMAVRALLP